MGAYFISGASVAGIGALVTVVFVIRRFYKLDEYITDLVKNSQKVGGVF